MAFVEPIFVVLSPFGGGTSAVASVLHHLGDSMGSESPWPIANRTTRCAVLTRVESVSTASVRRGQAWLAHALTPETLTCICARGDSEQASWADVFEVGAALHPLRAMP